MEDTVKNRDEIWETIVNSRCLDDEQLLLLNDIFEQSELYERFHGRTVR